MPTIIESFIPPTANEMFPKGKEAGAFIHNGSWGSIINCYCGRTPGYDAYSYENEDFLIFMAAGNFGSLGSGTVLAPAVGKNVVAGEHNIIRSL